MKRIWDYDMPVWMNLMGWVIGIAFVFGAIFGLLCFESWLIMLLWNVTLPAIFGFTTLTFWQAFGLNLLVWLLFGGIRKNVSGLKKND